MKKKSFDISKGSTGLSYGYSFDGGSTSAKITVNGSFSKALCKILKKRLNQEEYKMSDIEFGGVPLRHNNCPSGTANAVSFLFE